MAYFIGVCDEALEIQSRFSLLWISLWRFLKVRVGKNKYDSLSKHNLKEILNEQG